MSSFVDKSQPAEKELPEQPEAAAMPTDATLKETMKAMAYRIPGDVVNKATADLPDNQRSAIRRLHGYYMEHNLSLEEIGKLINYSTAAVTLAFRGKYEGKLDNIVKAVDAFFELDEKRSQGRRLDFIETSLTKRIWQVCEQALEFQKIAFIFGDQQIGKTEALKAYRDAHNHGSTVYVRVPAGGALGPFLISLARVLKIGDGYSSPKLRERIKGAFDERMLLIVDEAHACIKEGSRSQRAVEIIDYVREIFDEKQCGVVICATNVFRNAMNDDGPLHKILRQTKRRRLCAMQLPNVPKDEDLNTFAAAYKLPPATGTALELQKRMVEDEALGMWLTLLRMGAKIAAQKKQDMKWAHVLSARDGLKALEGSK